MKRSGKKGSFGGALLITLTLALLMAISSYAWLAPFLSGGAFGFVADELPPFTLAIARIPHNAQTESGEAARSYTECGNGKIEVGEDGAHLAVDISNMSFGSIDNVAQLKAENIVYLRLTVPQSLGDTIGIHFYYTDKNFIVLYKNEYDAYGNVTGTTQVTDEATLTNLVSVESAEQAGDAFLLYSCVVSNEAYEADAIAENVEFGENESLYKRFGTDSTAAVQMQNTDYASVPEDGCYYVYIKVIPNLSVFAYSIEHIASVMPCYMYFRIGASFESVPGA